MSLSLYYSDSQDTIKQFKRRGMKRKYFFIIIFLVIIFLGFFYINNVNNQIDKNLNKIATKYYSIMMPKSWVSKNISEFETWYFINDTKVASITVNLDCTYCSSTSSIITNWLGLHAYSIGEISEKKMKDYKLARVSVGYEQSAAEQIKNESGIPNELHYFLTNNNNTFIDFAIYKNELIKENLDKIAEPIAIK